MDQLSPEDRRAAQSVEIVCALLLCALVVAVPQLVLWLVDLSGGPEWSALGASTFTVSLVVGVGVMVLWLARARRRGL